jgi:hypothetical protein
MKKHRYKRNGQTCGEFKLRIPLRLANRLKTSAKRADRTVNSEMKARLEASFDLPTLEEITEALRWVTADMQNLWNTKFDKRLRRLK